VHLIGFIIRIYHDPWSPECQNATESLWTRSNEQTDYIQMVEVF